MSVIIRLQRLPWTATAADLREFFRGLNIPEGGVHIVGGRDGDAFIAFSTDEDARMAMQLDGKRIKDSRIKLLLSSRVEMQNIIEKARNEYAVSAATGAGAVSDPQKGASREHSRSRRSRSRSRSRSRGRSKQDSDHGSSRRSSRRPTERSRRSRSRSKPRNQIDPNTQQEKSHSLTAPAPVIQQPQAYVPQHQQAAAPLQPKPYQPAVQPELKPMESTNQYGYQPQIQQQQVDPTGTVQQGYNSYSTPYSNYSSQPQSSQPVLVSSNNMQGMQQPLPPGINSAAEQQPPTSAYFSGEFEPNPVYSQHQQEVQSGPTGGYPANTPLSAASIYQAPPTQTGYQASLGGAQGPPGYQAQFQSQVPPSQQGYYATAPSDFGSKDTTMAYSGPEIASQEFDSRSVPQPVDPYLPSQSQSQYAATPSATTYNANDANLPYTSPYPGTQAQYSDGLSGKDSAMASGGVSGTRWPTPTKTYTPIPDPRLQPVSAPPQSNRSPAEANKSMYSNYGPTVSQPPLQEYQAAPQPYLLASQETTPKLNYGSEPTTPEKYDGYRGFSASRPLSTSIASKRQSREEEPIPGEYDRGGFDSVRDSHRSGPPGHHGTGPPRYNRYSGSEPRPSISEQGRPYPHSNRYDGQTGPVRPTDPRQGPYAALDSNNERQVPDRTSSGAPPAWSEHGSYQQASAHSGPPKVGVANQGDKHFGESGSAPDQYMGYKAPPQDQTPYPSIPPSCDTQGSYVTGQPPQFSPDRSRPPLRGPGMPQDRPYLYQGQQQGAPDRFMPPYSSDGPRPRYRGPPPSTRPPFDPVRPANRPPPFRLPYPGSDNFRPRDDFRGAPRSVGPEAPGPRYPNRFSEPRPRFRGQFPDQRPQMRAPPPRVGPPPSMPRRGRAPLLATPPGKPTVPPPNFNQEFEHPPAEPVPYRHPPPVGSSGEFQYQGMPPPRFPHRPSDGLLPTNNVNSSREASNHGGNKPLPAEPLFDPNQNSQKGPPNFSTKPALLTGDDDTVKPKRSRFSDVEEPKSKVPEEPRQNVSPALPLGISSLSGRPAVEADGKLDKMYGIVPDRGESVFKMDESGFLPQSRPSKRSLLDDSGLAFPSESADVKQKPGLFDSVPESSTTDSVLIPKDMATVDDKTKLQPDLSLPPVIPDSSCIKMTGLAPQDLRYSKVREFFKPLPIRGQGSIKQVYNKQTRKSLGEFYVKFLSKEDAGKALNNYGGKENIRLETISEAIFDDTVDGPPSEDDEAEPATNPVKKSDEKLICQDTAEPDSAPGITHGVPNIGARNSVFLMGNDPPKDPLPQRADKAAGSKETFSANLAVPLFGKSSGASHQAPKESSPAPPDLKVGSRGPEVKRSPLIEPQHPKEATPKPFICVVENVPYRATPNDLGDFFGGPNAVLQVRIPMSSSGKPTGRAFLQLTTEADVRMAKLKNNQYFLGRSIRVTDSNEEIMHRQTGFRGVIPKTPPRPVVESQSKGGSLACDSPCTPNLNTKIAGTPSTGGAPPLIISETPPSSNGQVPVAPNELMATNFNVKNDTVGMTPEPIIVPDTCVFLTGLPPGASQRDIVAFFDGLSIVPVGGVHLMKEPKGSAYVEFKDPNDVGRALDKNRQYIGSRAVMVRSCCKEDMQEALHNQYNANQGQDRMQDKAGLLGTSMLSPLFDTIKPASSMPVVGQQLPVQAQQTQSIGPPVGKPTMDVGPPPGHPTIDPAMALSIGLPNCVIAMHNLPATVTLEEICDLFSGFSVIDESVRMHYSPSGVPTGDCLLAVATPDDAIKAVQRLNGRDLGGKQKLLLYVVPC